MPSIPQAFHQGLAADKPSADAAVNQGWLYFETDTNLLKQSWNGAWVSVGHGGASIGPQVISASVNTDVPLTLEGVASQGGDMLDIDASHSTRTNPATVTSTGLTTGRAIRYGGVGSDNITYDGLRIANAYSTQLIAYFAIELHGNEQQGSDPAYSMHNDRAVHIPIFRATDVGVVIQGVASQTGDLQQWRDSGDHPQFGIANAGSGGSPVWALRAREVANAESMAQTHTLGSYTGRSIQVIDDSGATIGWLPLYA